MGESGMQRLGFYSLPAEQTDTFFFAVTQITSRRFCMRVIMERGTWP
jgi:hypothetical protein